MRDAIGSVVARARRAVAIFAIATLGCTSTVLVTPRYEPTGISLPVGVGQGARIRFLVVDERSNQLHLGITEDTYKENIQLTRPIVGLVEDAFHELLSQAGFLLSDQADTTYQVKIRSVTTVSAHAFGAKARAHVSLRVSIIAGEEDLGGKVVSGWGTVDQGASTPPDGPCSEALSVALSEAVERAIADPELAELARSGAGSDAQRLPEPGVSDRPQSNSTPR